MKVLLDENMPHALRGCLRPHQTTTVAHMGWAGWKNGELLDAAENAAFDVLVTGDLSLAYQQNMSGRKIAIVSLSANNWPIYQDLCREDLRGCKCRGARIVYAGGLRGVREDEKKILTSQACGVHR